MLQGLDVHSTLSGINRGTTYEKNAMMRGIVARPALLIGYKAGVGGATILSAHKMAKHDRIASIVMLAAINGLYTTVVIHNYRIR